MKAFGCWTAGLCLMVAVMIQQAEMLAMLGTVITKCVARLLPWSQWFKDAHVCRATFQGCTCLHFSFVKAQQCGLIIFPHEKEVTYCSTYIGRQCCMWASKASSKLGLQHILAWKFKLANSYSSSHVYNDSHLVLFEPTGKATLWLYCLRTRCNDWCQKTKQTSTETKLLRSTEYTQMLLTKQKSSCLCALESRNHT